MPCPLHELRKHLRFLDGNGTDQHRLPFCVELLDLLNHRLELFPLGLVDHIREVGTQQRPVGRNDHHIQLVYLVELLRLGIGGSGHAGSFSYMRK